MFKKLESELILTYKLRTKSPLFIASGNDNSLDPSATDEKYIEVFRNGKLEPYIPGTSLKGVFRSRAERILKSANEGSCDIVARDECVPEKSVKLKDGKLQDGKERYERSCPVCRLFGSKVLRSRVTVSDLYVTGNYKVGERTCVGIDRVTGAAKKGALYNMQYIEDTEFQGKMTLQNFESYQLRLLLELFRDMNEGFITLGGLTSKGFGQVEAYDFKINIRYYGRKEKLEGYANELYYQGKTVEGFDEIYKLVKDVDIHKVKRGDEVDEQTI